MPLATVQPINPSDAQGKAVATVRILLADDHTVVRQGLRKVLEERPDWKVVAEAGDGREAVDREREVFQLIAEGKTNKDIAALLFISPARSKRIAHGSWRSSTCTAPRRSSCTRCDAASFDNPHPRLTSAATPFELRNANSSRWRQSLGLS